MTRFQLHLDDEAVVEFIDEFKTLVRRYVDERRAGDDAISYGGIFVLHRMAGDA